MEKINIMRSLCLYFITGFRIFCKSFESLDSLSDLSVYLEDNYQNRYRNGWVLLILFWVFGSFSLYFSCIFKTSTDKRMLSFESESILFHRIFKRFLNLWAFANLPQSCSLTFLSEFWPLPSPASNNSGFRSLFSDHLRLVSSDLVVLRPFIIYWHFDLHSICLL